MVVTLVAVWAALILITLIGWTKLHSRFAMARVENTARCFTIDTLNTDRDAYDDEDAA